MPLAVQQATDRFPVTLFTFACGETCDNATALLNRRGVPFATVNVEEARRRAEAPGPRPAEQTAPVLSGRRQARGQKGFNEARWNALLDQAGYPKTPARRSSQPLRPLTEPKPEARAAVKIEPVPEAPQAASAYPK